MARNIMVHALAVWGMIDFAFGSQGGLVAALEVADVAFLAVVHTGFSEI